jgi:hypothetical protein
MTEEELYNWFYENFDLEYRSYVPGSDENRKIILKPKTEIGEFLRETHRRKRSETSELSINLLGTFLSEEIFTFLKQFYNLTNNTIWGTIKIISKEFRQ